jgi:hypothetical protein
MRRTYFTWEEDEAYRDGRRDASMNREDHFRDSRMFSEPDSPDRAYWDGQEEYKKEQERKRLEEDYWNEQYNDR